MRDSSACEKISFWNYLNFIRQIQFGNGVHLTFTGFHRISLNFVAFRCISLEFRLSSVCVAASTRSLCSSRAVRWSDTTPEYVACLFRSGLYCGLCICSLPVVVFVCPYLPCCLAISVPSLFLPLFAANSLHKAHTQPHTHTHTHTQRAQTRKPHTFTHRRPTFSEVQRVVKWMSTIEIGKSRIYSSCHLFWFSFFSRHVLILLSFACFLKRDSSCLSSCRECAAFPSPSGISFRSCLTLAGCGLCSACLAGGDRSFGW